MPEEMGIRALTRGCGGTLLGNESGLDFAPKGKGDDARELACQASEYRALVPRGRGVGSEGY